MTWRITLWSVLHYASDCTFISSVNIIPFLCMSVLMIDFSVFWYNECLIRFVLGNYLNLPFHNQGANLCLYVTFWKSTKYFYELHSLMCRYSSELRTCVSTYAGTIIYYYSRYHYGFKFLCKLNIIFFVFVW